MNFKCFVFIVGACPVLNLQVFLKLSPFIPIEDVYNVCYSNFGTERTSNIIIMRVLESTYSLVMWKSRALRLSFIKRGKAIFSRYNAIRRYPSFSDLQRAFTKRKWVEIFEIKKVFSILHIVQFWLLFSAFAFSSFLFARLLKISLSYVCLLCKVLVNIINIEQIQN